MIEEVFKNIFRIGVVLPGNPLKEVNCYFIRGDKTDLLIDTGFNRDACRDALKAGLEELGSDPERRDVLATHLHSDHCGMANQFVGTERHIYMSDEDLSLLETFRDSRDPEYHYHRFVREGFTQEMMDEIYRTNPAFTEGMTEIDDRFIKLKDGDVVRAGDYELETILVPGHTPGNCMFYIRDKKLLFTGDHILFDITPNITYWPRVNDSLGDYLDSLKRAREMDVEVPLPGHRKPADYYARIDELLVHHERRLADALGIVKEYPGYNATEIAGLMKWKIHSKDWESFPLIQKWFAVGECLSHLDYHMLHGNVRCEEEDGVMIYYAV